MISTLLDDEIAQSDADGLLALARDYLQKPLHAIFIASFSEGNNSISQWERYAASGLGYCIGFAMHAVAASALAQERLTLRKMTYGVASQLNLVRNRIAVLRGQFVPEIALLSGSARSDAVDLAAILFSLALEQLALELKNPLFEDEHEWRLIREVRRDPSLPNPEPVPSERRGNFVKPFIEVSLRMPSEKKLPIWAVVCGPKLDGELAISTAQDFLEDKKYDEIVPKWSELHKIWR